MNILGTGLSGLVGSRIVELLTPAHTFVDLSLTTGVDITDHEAVMSRISASDAPWVFHFAALTDVDGAEVEQGDKSGAFWRVNVLATEAIVEACRQTNKKLLYLSSDYVFDGAEDVYTEKSTPNPQSWYGVTKYEGEKRVAALASSGCVVRIANPYRRKHEQKADFVHRIVDRLQERLPVSAPDDQTFVPTFVDDLAYALGSLVETPFAHGVFHVVGSEVLSPFAAAKLIAGAYGFDEQHIEKTTFREFFYDRAPRPFHGAIRSDRISELGIKMSDFASGITLVASQDAQAHK